MAQMYFPLIRAASQACLAPALHFSSLNFSRLLQLRLALRLAFCSG